MTATSEFSGVSLSEMTERLHNEQPEKILKELSKKVGTEINSPAFAKFLDKEDELTCLKEEFIFPTYVSEDKEKKYVYLSGNVRGLQPKSTKQIVTEVLNSWANKGAECHFVEPLPAAWCEEYLSEQLGKLVGAKPEEVVAMNSVDLNLHLMLVSFYQPNSKRHKILFDGEAQNIDVVKSQIMSHGLKVSESLLSVPYRDNTHFLNMDDLLAVIEQNGESISTILLPAILPKSGQLLEIEKITKLGHEKGCMVGFILNDAVGNVELKLNEWGVDFACWDTGKYLNAGSSSMGCAFLHEKHSLNDFPKFTGWWSHKMSSRFEMTNELDRTPGINGYKLSNISPLKIAQIKAGLDIFDKVPIKKIREKTRLLTGYFKVLLEQSLCAEKDNIFDKIQIITPKDSSEHGAQLSLFIKDGAKEIHEKLKKRGIVCSYYSSDILTVCLAPLYCSFQDVLQFVTILYDILK